MKIVRFKDPSGYTRLGEWKGDKLNAGNIRYDLEEVDILPPCKPSKIVCIGLNYLDHIEETGREKPSRPELFLKPPNTLVGHLNTIFIPRKKKRVDYEGELGVVINKQCKNVAIEESEEYILGYTCVNDISNRDDQRKERNWVRGKAFDCAAPVGPVIATLDEVPSDAKITTRLNGDIRQKSSIDKMLFSIPELIEEISRYMTLEPGDIISTGTPSGVGPITEGDTIEIEIEGIGVLKNPVSLNK